MWEAPCLSKLVDILCFHTETGDCVAIEVKLRDWRRALRQASVYQLLADRAYVALWDAHIGAVDQNAFRERGVGLITVSIDGNVRHIIDATVSERRMHNLSLRLVGTLFPEAASIGCLRL